MTSDVFPFPRRCRGRRGCGSVYGRSRARFLSREVHRRSALHVGRPLRHGLRTYSLVSLLQRRGGVSLDYLDRGSGSLLSARCSGGMVSIGLGALGDHATVMGRYRTMAAAEICYNGVLSSGGILGSDADGSKIGLYVARADGPDRSADTSGSGDCSVDCGSIEDNRFAVGNIGITNGGVLTSVCDNCCTCCASDTVCNSKFYLSPSFQSSIDLCCIADLVTQSALLRMFDFHTTVDVISLAAGSINCAYWIAVSLSVETFSKDAKS